MQTTTKWVLVAIAGLALLVSGCKDDVAKVGDALCGTGERLTVEEEDYCVYGAELIIEGFRCPGSLSQRNDFDGFAVCSGGGDLSDRFLDRLRERGRNPLPLPKADPGDMCAQPGAEVEANDGCNTCTCEGGNYSCTEIACGNPQPECGDMNDEDACVGLRGDGPTGCVWLECPQDDFDCPNPNGGFCIQKAEPDEVCEDLGISIPASDGCNSCFCDEGNDGRYSCTEIACGDPDPEPEPEPICDEDDSFQAENGCDCFCVNGDWDCNPEGCMTAACEEGVELPAGDGCNTCTCPNGVWTCTEMDCGNPQPECGDMNDEDACVGLRGDGPTGCVWLECPQDDFDCPNPNGGFCIQKAEPDEVCEDLGISIPASDGCNSCFCDSSNGGGRYSCTELACDD